MPYKFLYVLSIFLLLPLNLSTCIVPRGIKTPSVYSLLPPNSPAANDSSLFKFIFTSIPAIILLETPIQFHRIQSVIVPVFNTMGAFEPLALDIWGREPPVRFCADAPHFDLYRRVALAYITLWAMKVSFPTVGDKFDALVENWGIVPELCNQVDRLESCDDVATPWGHAWMRVKEIEQWLANDGWNSDGALSRDYNRIPYQDWSRRPYTPRNNPWELSNKRKWQPLLEHDNRGFLFYQQHVTPHIGQFGRSFFLDDHTYCNLTAPNPRYNYQKELDLVISRSATMADNDVMKAKVELFDVKATSLFLIQSNLLVARNISVDSWKFLVDDIVGITVMYEAVMLVWKEKIRHDAIRPPTRLRADRSGDKVMAYAGPNQGKQQIAVDDWEPYFRTMPHAEYPSGSSCFCKAFGKAMQLLSGDDFIVDGKKISLPLVLAAGSSRAEPGKPFSDVNLFYSKWSDIVKDCGQSRLDGGLHFSAAVPEGEKLCEPVVEKVFDAFMKLVNGKKPSFVQKFDAKLRRERRCK